MSDDDKIGSGKTIKFNRPELNEYRLWAIQGEATEELRHSHDVASLDVEPRPDDVARIGDVAKQWCGKDWWRGIKFAKLDSWHSSCQVVEHVILTSQTTHWVYMAFKNSEVFK